MPLRGAEEILLLSPFVPSWMEVFPSGVSVQLSNDICTANNCFLAGHRRQKDLNSFMSGESMHFRE